MTLNASMILGLALWMLVQTGSVSIAGTVRGASGRYPVYARYGTVAHSCASPYRLLA